MRWSRFLSEGECSPVGPLRRRYDLPLGITMGGGSHGILASVRRADTTLDVGSWVQWSSYSLTAAFDTGGGMVLEGRPGSIMIPFCSLMGMLYHYDLPFGL